MKLTQKSAASITLPKGKREHVVFDDDLPGFGLRLRASGARSWVYQYDIGKKTRRATLGNATALPATRAREMAIEMHAMHRLGRDPIGEKISARAKAVETMAAALQNYLIYQRGHLKPRSFVECERHLTKYCKSLHGSQLTKIDRRQIATTLSAIAGKSGKVTANRARASLSAFFSWAMKEGLIDANPVIGTNRQPEKSRQRVLGDGELKIIWDALGADDYSTVVKLLMITGQRADEIAALRWSEIHQDRIVLPAARTKNSREHIIPMSTAVRAIVNGRERNDEFVFGRRSGRPFRGWGVCKAALDERISKSGVPLEHWTHHDLRRSAATGMVTLGILPHIVEAILNHVSGHKSGIAGIYNRADYEVPKRIALQKWSDHIETLITGKPSSTVVSLRGA